jgi:hypothetical protein
MDRASYGPSFESTQCPDTCRGELREACSGCDYFNEEGEPIEQEKPVK